MYIYCVTISQRLIKSVCIQQPDNNCTTNLKCILGNVVFNKRRVLIGYRVTSHLSRGLKTSGGWRGKLLHQHTLSLSLYDYISTLSGNPRQLRYIIDLFYFLLFYIVHRSRRTRVCCADCMFHLCPFSHHERAGGEVYRGWRCCGAHRGQTGGYGQHDHFTSS